MTYGVVRWWQWCWLMESEGGGDGVGLWSETVVTMVLVDGEVRW